MQVIFEKLKKSFEECLLDSLIRNENKKEFEKIRHDLINQASKEEFGDYQSNICLVLSKIYNNYLLLLSKSLFAITCACISAVPSKILKILESASILLIGVSLANPIPP